MGLIIFDFDGTVADTRSTILHTVEATVEKMKWPELDLEKVAGAIGLPLKANFTIGASMPDDIADEAVMIYRELFNGIATQHATLFPGAMETLGTLSSRGVPMAIATSRTVESLKFLMEQLGIDGFITNLYGAGCVENPKPAPDMVLLILDRMGFSPSETLVVGDTTYDLEMGRNAGCYTCGVTYGNHSVQQLAAVRPDYLIDDLRKLL